MSLLLIGEFGYQLMLVNMDNSQIIWFALCSEWGIRFHLWAFLGCCCNWWISANKIVKNHEIAVNSEEHVFTAIAKWIEYDVENRRKEFENLLSRIRTSKISDTVNISEEK